MSGRTGFRPRLQLLRQHSGWVGLAILLLFAVLAACSWLGLTGQDWAVVSGDRWEGASADHPLGTNAVGQDVLQRALFSVRVAFDIGLTVALASTVLGAALGGIAGWYHDRWGDGLLTWLMGVLDSMPFYLLVAALAFALQGNRWAMHIAMIATFWTTTGRLVRGEVMRMKSREFILSARAMGLPVPVILMRHVLPNTVPLLIVQAALVFIAAIKAEVILSFLGLGVQDGVSWGLMLAEATQDVLAGHFNNFGAASLMLFTLLLGLNLFADALQDALDPKQVAA